MLKCVNVFWWSGYYFVYLYQIKFLKTMRIFTVDFIAIYPVPCGLVIAANDIDEATMIARETITHTTDFTVTEVDISKPVVVIFDHVSSIDNHDYYYVARIL